MEQLVDGVWVTLPPGMWAMRALGGDLQCGLAGGPGGCLLTICLPALPCPCAVMGEDSPAAATRSQLLAATPGSAFAASPATGPRASSSSRPARGAVGRAVACSRLAPAAGGKQAAGLAGAQGSLENLFGSIPLSGLGDITNQVPHPGIGVAAGKHHQLAL